MSTSEQLKNAPSDKEKSTFSLDAAYPTKSFYAPNTQRYDIVLTSGAANIKVNGVVKGTLTTAEITNFFYSGEFSIEGDPEATGHVKSV